MRKPLQGFQLVATAGEFEGAMELKNLSRLKAVFKEAYDAYEPLSISSRVEEDRWS
jgi:hypothetical protein